MTQHKKKSKKFNIIRVILLTVVALILGFSIYNWNAENLTGNKIPMPLGYGASIILSGSMEPTLSVDDLVIIKETENIKENDIVVYQDGNSLVIHRVIKIEGDKITAKGDANNTADEPINKSQIKGVLIYNIGGVGAAVNIIKHPFSVVVILAAVLLVTELSYRKEKDKDTDELAKIMKEIEKLKKG